MVSIEDQVSAIVQAMPGLKDYACKVDVDESVYGEPFSLREIYLPLNAWREVSREGENPSKRSKRVKEVFEIDAF